MDLCCLTNSSKGVVFFPFPFPFDFAPLELSSLMISEIATGPEKDLSARSFTVDDSLSTFLRTLSRLRTGSRAELLWRAWQSWTILKRKLVLKQTSVALVASTVAPSGSSCVLGRFSPDPVPRPTAGLAF